jgi:hypothetical protein
VKFIAVKSIKYMERKIRSGSINIILLLLLFTNCDIFAQVKAKEREKFSDKIFFGGSIGAGISTYVTEIDILPFVGLWILPQWSLGTGGRYTFRKERNFNNGSTHSYSANIWGLSGFTDILPIRDLDKTFKIGIHGGPIFHGEWEGLYLDKGMFNPTSTVPKGKGWVHLFLVGGGYRLPVGRKSAINLLVLWDLTNNRYSPYTTNPLLRLSVNF